jgi:hypothetical protein
MMIPARVALALQADGWWLRSEIVWAKPNPMPESVRDRPTRSHEMVYLLTKAERYYYDAEAIAEPVTDSSIVRLGQDVDGQAGSNRANGGMKTNGPMKAVRFGGTKADPTVTRLQSGNEWKPKTPGRNSRLFQDRDPNHSSERKHEGQDTGGNGHGFAGHSGNVLADGTIYLMRNSRDVWTIATSGYREAHFATFPQELVRRCILAGSKVGDTVLDPFVGSGTVVAVALGLGRRGLGMDLNHAYIEMARRRMPLLMVMT